LRQYRFSVNDFVSAGETGYPDAVLNDSDLSEIKRLAGINTVLENTHTPVDEQENISHTAMKRVDYMKTHNIQPGTDEWFALWFSKPYLTGTTGMKS